MKKIDWYILKRYLSSFFFILLLFSMLSVIIDASEKIDDFLTEDGPTFHQVMFEYYINFVPFINGLLTPLFSLIAVVFFTSRLAANSEFIAMLGNGINFYRLLFPYLVGACLIAGIHFVGNHYLIPISNKTRTTFENTYIWKHNFVGAGNDFHLSCGPQEEFYLQRFNKYDSSGSSLAWIQYDTTGARKLVVKAQRIKLLNQSNRWRLSGLRTRETISPMHHNVTAPPPQEFIDTTLCLFVSDLIKRDNYKDNMTTPELIKYIDAQKAKGVGGTTVFEVERYRRSADPFSIIILTLIGFSVASRKMRGGMAWHLVIGMLVCGLYIFIGKFTTTFSISGGLYPIVGTWIPNVFFSFVAVAMLLRSQK
jgi:lipopolysaccharide export system permease protein